jgi:flagellar M-ring protein FliF
MDENNGMLSGFSQQSKIALLVASIVTLVVLGLAANWVFNKEYRSLFADLAPKDSAAVMKQLEELKIPYKINSKTGNLEVPSSEVHNTRLQLMVLILLFPVAWGMKFLIIQILG